PYTTLFRSIDSLLPYRNRGHFPVPIEYSENLLGDVFDQPHAFNVVVHTLLLVELHQLLRFFLVRLEPLADQFFAIVRPAEQLLAAKITNSRGLRRAAVFVVNFATTGTHEPADEPVGQ